MNKTTITPRPTWNRSMAQQLAKEAAPDLALIFKPIAVTLQQVEADCTNIFEYGYNKNGFELAKEFDKLGYHCDSMVVDELDSLSFDDILTGHIKHWVKANNIQPQFRCSDIVKFNSGLVKTIPAK